MKLFSVVMAVYRNDDPEQFKIALASLLSQSACPTEIIVVVDGPVGSDINDVLEQIDDNPIIRLIRLESNLGLGPARNIAIGKCKYDIIAVMDSDDVCANNRFELQLKALDTSTVDLVGGFIEEFDQVPGDRPRIRSVPLSHVDILARGQWRSPINHVTIMFRRDAYYRSGGYKDFRYVEDYDMFYRMFMTGVQFKNLADILVYVRCGNGMLQRRAGMKYLKFELALLCRMRLSGFISFPIWLIGAGIRVAVRLSPNIVSIFIYKCLRR